MNCFSLLSPNIKATLRSITSKNKALRFILFLVSLVIIWASYSGLLYFFKYVGKGETLGPVLGPIAGLFVLNKIFEMLCMALFFMLLFSSIVSAFSELYLDNELYTLMASPVPPANIFLSRFISMTFSSSWMTLLFFSPVFMAYATAMNCQNIAYFIFTFFLLSYVLLPNIIGAVTALVLGSFFPVRQMKKLFQFLSVLVLTGLIFLLRSLEAEKLMNPKHYARVSEYFRMLELPLSDKLPSSWFYDSAKYLFIDDYSGAMSKILPLLLSVAIGIIGLYLLAKFFYLKSWQRSIEALDNQVLSLEILRKILIYPFKYFKRDFKVIAEKEITTFLRDPAVFSQLFMMIAIVLIYAYNLSIMPLKDIPSFYTKGTNNMLVYLNGPFIGFILSAIGMRFVYPSISLEGRAFWAVKSSPVLPRRIMIIKFLLYLLPMLVLGLILCAISNSMFEVSHPALMWLSYLNVIMISTVTTALAIGSGTVFANFSSDAALKISGSYGGFIYMILTGIYIINLVILELYPMYKFSIGSLVPEKGYIAFILPYISVIVVLMCTALWIYIPLKKGLEKIDNYEPR